MKTTMKLVKSFLMALAITAFTASCQKDNLEDAVLPQTAQGEQSTSGTSGQNATSGAQGERGEKGLKGDKGDQGEPGVAGPEGPEGPAGEAIGVPGPKGDTGATGATGPEGPTGETGPAGPKGDAGATGATGPEGSAGEAGADGASNIMYSEWLDQDLTEQDFPKFKQMSVPEPELTDEFLNNGGVVLGFFRFTTAVHNLPYTHVSQQTLRDMIFSPTSGGRVLFSLRSTDNAVLDNEDIEGINPAFNPQYKYVLIPGGINLSGKSQKDLKKMSYEELMNHFGLSY